MRAFDRAWWFRQSVIIAVSELLGYLLSVELRDRYPQEVCFFVVFCAITTLDELRARRKSRRTSNQISNTQPPPPDRSIRAIGPAAANATAPQRAAVNATASRTPNAVGVVIPLRPPGA